MTLQFQEGSGAAGHCSVAESARRDCGFVGINQSKCVKKGCCWQPCQGCGAGVPWCFYGKGRTGARPDGGIMWCKYRSLLGGQCSLQIFQPCSVNFSASCLDLTFSSFCYFPCSLSIFHPASWFFPFHAPLYNISVCSMLLFKNYCAPYPHAPFLIFMTYSSCHCSSEHLRPCSFLQNQSNIAWL